MIGFLSSSGTSVDGFDWAPVNSVTVPCNRRMIVWQLQSHVGELAR